jgi:hypothetical protein
VKGINLALWELLTGNCVILKDLLINFFYRRREYEKGKSCFCDIDYRFDGIVGMHPRNSGTTTGIAGSSPSGGRSSSS